MEIETELFGGRNGGNKTIKFPFIFLAAPPTPPAENGSVRKFLVLVRDWKEREARIVRFTTKSERTIWERVTTRSTRAKSIKIMRILLIQCSNFVQKTPPIFTFWILAGILKSKNNFCLLKRKFKLTTKPFSLFDSLLGLRPEIL